MSNVNAKLARLFFAGCVAVSAAVVQGALTPARVMAVESVDDEMPCPGERCTGREMPVCCTAGATVGGGPIPGGQTNTHYYYFPSQT